METLQKQIADQLNNRKSPYLSISIDYVLQDGTIQMGGDFFNPQSIFKYIQIDKKYYEEKGNRIVSVKLNFHDETTLVGSY
jgi:hypothetical protein